MLTPGGCDLCLALLLPTLLAGQQGEARTRRRAAHLLTAAGLHAPHWRRLNAVIIQAVTATKQQPSSGNAVWRRGIFVTLLPTRLP